MQKYVYESRRNECGNKERKQSTKEKSEEIHEQIKEMTPIEKTTNNTKIKERMNNKLKVCKAREWKRREICIT